MKFRLAFLIVGAVLLAGCDSGAKRSASSEVLSEVAQQRSKLDEAHDMILRMEDFEREAAIENIISLLNGYLSEHKPKAEWKSDPLVGRLPRVIRALPLEQNLSSLTAQYSDVVYLDEAHLLYCVAQWSTKRALPPEFEAWINSPDRKLSREHARELQTAWLMFDWTIRNIQLDPLPEQPREEVVVPAVAGENAGNTNVPLSLRGAPGPGYTAYPWYTLMSGHGDAWQRMRIFTLLARQQGIEVVTLAIVDKEDDRQTTPWVSGALIGNQLYLFDPALGLPIPDASGAGVATLEQARAEPSLLKALDFDADHLYRVGADDLGGITALIDGSLESLSQRMQILENGLSGERQLKLTVNATELAARLRKSPGVANAYLWSVPIEAAFFEAAILQSYPMRPRPPLFAAIWNERSLLEQRWVWHELRQISKNPADAKIVKRHCFAEARRKHLRGEFDDQADETGAKSLYVGARITDAEIDSLDKNELLQRLLGLSEIGKEAKTPQERAAAFAEVKQQIRGIKRDATYWLGLIHYENNDFDAAVNWLDQRTLKNPAAHWWEPGARYNLGRTYEALQANKLARELYLGDESPQSHGNLLRAKRLQ